MLLLRLFLGAVFLLSAIVKVPAPRQFVRDVRGYRILPGSVAAVFGWVLPYVELAIAGSLLTGFGVRWAALAAAFLLIAFMVVVGIAMIRRLNLNCSCFGILYRERVGWRTLIRDTILLGIASAVVLGSQETLTVADMLAKPITLSHSTGLVATAAAIGIGVAGLVFTVRALHRHRGDVSVELG